MATDVLQIAAFRIVDHLGPGWRHMQDYEKRRCLVFKLGRFGWLWFNSPFFIRDMLLTKRFYKSVMKLWIAGDNWALLTIEPQTAKIVGQYPASSKIEWQELLSAVVVEVSEVIHASDVE